MVGLLAQPEKRLVGHDVAELQAWSSWRRLPTRRQLIGDTARTQHHVHDKGHRDRNEQTPKTPPKTGETAMEMRETCTTKNGGRIVCRVGRNSEKNGVETARNSTPNAASSSRQAAAASMCTTPGAASCSAPSGADSSPVGGPQNETDRDKQGSRHV